MSTLYIIAKGIWRIAKWVWTAIVVVILVSVASSILVQSTKTAVESTANNIIGWLSQPEALPRITLILLGCFVFISLAAGLIVALLKKKYESKAPQEEMLAYYKQRSEAAQKEEEAQHKLVENAYQHYLRTLEEMLKTIRPRGFAHPTHPVILAEVPLQTVFVPPRLVFDAPVYDAPEEQMRQLSAISRRKDVPVEIRERYVQGLGTIWYSQVGGDVDEKKALQPQRIMELLQSLTAVNPIAVLLGTPGSGKTTLLHWLAWNMAQARLPGGVPLPQGFGKAQIPVLIQTSEYAEQLAKEPLTLKAFLLEQWSNIDPRLPAKLLEELDQGHCFVLFDGLDQGATGALRRRVIDAAQAFITEYGVPDKADAYNRFLITSRIADYEPGTFAAYPHYTLLELDQWGIEQMVTNWCVALARYRAMASKSMQPLTGAEDAQACTAGSQQQVTVFHTLKSCSGLMSLAVNPLALTFMTLLHMSGWNLHSQRMELYQMVVRTLLDTWNQESGHTMFSGEEMPQVERLLSMLAYHQQEQAIPLTTDEVMMVAHQVMAEVQQRKPGEFKEREISQILKTLRRSSGLFVEGGEDLSYFAHSAFQDYYSAHYLLHMTPNAFKDVATKYCSLPSWKEPLLLALTYKSRLHNPEEAQTAHEVMQAILAVQDETTALQRAIFACTSLVEGVNVERVLQQQIAESLLEVAGDPHIRGSAPQNYQRLEAIMLAWLQQSLHRDLQGSSMPPLVIGWMNASSGRSVPIRQVGAIQLFADLAPALLTLPAPIVYTLVAPLVQLAQLDIQSMPEHLRATLPQPPARAASQAIEQNAYQALRRLVSAGQQCQQMPGDTRLLLVYIAQQLIPPGVQKKVSAQPFESLPRS